MISSTLPLDSVIIGIEGVVAVVSVVSVVADVDEVPAKGLLNENAGFVSSNFIMVVLGSMLGLLVGSLLAILPNFIIEGFVSSNLITVFSGVLAVDLSVDLLSVVTSLISLFKSLIILFNLLLTSSTLTSDTMVVLSYLASITGSVISMISILAVAFSISA